ncbi:putative phosphatidylinositol 3-kinase [Helianthus annuus]|nr:putative phosphatidylinositol 3-kinase [Helianthus annuus]
MILQRILRLLTNIGCELFHLNIYPSWICSTHAHKLKKVVSKRIASISGVLQVKVLLIAAIFLVCAHAVSVLERADDEELQCYLLQLVQAMRFERLDKSRLSQFLVQRSLTNIEFSSFVRWYVVAELNDRAYAKCFYCTYQMLEENMIKVRFCLVITYRIS